MQVLSSSWLWCLPLLGGGVALGTIRTCYVLTRHHGHLPVGVTTPPISFLGTEEPEHTVYVHTRAPPPPPPPPPTFRADGRTGSTLSPRVPREARGARREA